MKQRTKRRLRILAVVLALIGALTFAAFYRGLVTRRYEMASPKLPAGEAIRIVILSDLHSYIYEPGQEPIVRRVKDLKPDVILLSGDMADDRNPLPGFLLLLKGVVPLAPCYYVTGSHDYWGGDIAGVKAAVAAAGAIVLQGQTERLVVRGMPLFISGIDDPIMAPAGQGESEDSAYRRALNKGFGSLDRSAFNLLAAHRPDFYAEYKALGFDLAACGHTHGGQVRIPFFLNGLFAPNQGWFPKYAGGLYEEEGTSLVVSRGLSYYPELPRIFNPPEIVLVTVKGTGGSAV